jgi:hypothetical protein
VRFRELAETEKAINGPSNRRPPLPQWPGRFLDVIEAERSLFTTQAQLAQSERTMSQSLVRLYKALGGGWNAAEAPGYAAKQTGHE